MISKAIQGFNWDKTFSDKSTDEKASILTKAILNVMRTLFRMKQLPLMTESLHRLIMKSSLLLKKLKLNILRVVSSQLVPNH